MAIGRARGAEILVVTAHNPMGALRTAEANDAAHVKLLRDVREMRPAPAAAYPAASIDAVGGAEVWCEIGVGIELPEDPRDAAETARAVRKWRGNTDKRRRTRCGATETGGRSQCSRVGTDWKGWRARTCGW